MDSFFVRFKNPLTLVAIMVLQVIALAIQVPRSANALSPGGHHDGRKVTLLRYWMASALMPFERVTHGTSLEVRGLWNNYINLRHARDENTALKQEITRLHEEQDAFAEDAAQGRRLQTLLQFKQQYITATVAAQVVGTSGNDHANVVTLDKGSADGLKPDQAVITPDGVVGKLRDVWPHSSQLLLINDASSGAGVILGSSRIRGILRGNANGQVTINNLLADSRIKSGDQIVTSGGDGVFPRGIPVGVVQSIEPDPQHQPFTLITIKPNANLYRLEEVLIITGTDSSLPPMAQQDAAVAEATAEANKRAADLIAEKLPSVKNGGANGATGSTGDDENTRGGVPGVPNSGLPKVPPALHSDRYSPGATPPATDLTPGAPSNPASSSQPSTSQAPK